MRAVGWVQSVFLLVLLVPGAAPGADTTPAIAGHPTLKEEILRADADLFDSFNRGDLEGVARMFAPDLEFYQDDEGLASYRKTLDDLRGMFAQATGMHRELDATTVDIRPIKGYGAMEMGTHRFCHREAGNEICGDFRFVHIWRQENGKWQLARVISYGHKIEE